MNASPFISVLLPVYNGEGDLEATVSHILSQTFTNFELLMLDDGSIDSSWKLMNELAGKDSRIRLFQQSNAGIVSALNRLASEALGDILIREDCGDLSQSHRYQLQVEALLSEPSASACVSPYWILEESGEPIGIRKIPESSNALREHLKQTNSIAHPTFAMRKIAFMQTKGYDAEARHAEDYDLLIKLLEIGPIIPLSQPLVAVKLNPLGLTFRNLQTQAAHSQRIRSKHFGASLPVQLDFPALSPDQARAEYHKLVGKLYLVKGKPESARIHLTAAKNYGNKHTRLLRLLTFFPGKVTKILRAFRKAHTDPQPFTNSKLHC